MARHTTSSTTIRLPQNRWLDRVCRLLRSESAQTIPVDYRGFPRLQTTVFFRELGSRMFAQPCDSGATSRLRIYSDEKLRVGQPLEVDVLIDGDLACFHGRVLWIVRNDPMSPAKYDVGLEVTANSQAQSEQIQQYCI